MKDSLLISSGIVSTPKISPYRWNTQRYSAKLTSCVERVRSGYIQPISALLIAAHAPVLSQAYRFESSRPLHCSKVQNWSGCLLRGTVAVDWFPRIHTAKAAITLQCAPEHSINTLLSNYASVRFIPVTFTFTFLSHWALCLVQFWSLQHQKRSEEWVHRAKSFPPHDLVGPFTLTTAMSQTAVFKLKFASKTPLELVADITCRMYSSNFGVK